MLPKALKQKEDTLRSLHSELDAARKEMESGTTLSRDRGREIEEKCEEAQELAAELARYGRVSGVVEDPILPGAMDGYAHGPSQKSLGEQFVQSQAFKKFTSDTWPTGMPSERFSAPASLPREQKAITTGTGVIRSNRDPREVQVPQHDTLTIRDVTDTRPTAAGSEVDYVTITPGTNTAAPVAKGDPKPEMDVALGRATAPVRTLAVTTPIDEADLDDIVGVSRIVDDELSYALKLVEERQMLWGIGTGENLQGIVTLGGVPSITTGTAQLIDRIASGMIMVRTAGFSPNAVIVHPVDFETIIQLKEATTNAYLYAEPGSDFAGLRIWGMRVIVTPSAKSPTATTRSLVVGDFRRGATIYDRRQMALQLGWVNDQFLRNQRTIRVEERLAFAIRSPLAFAKYQTAA